VCKQAEQVPVIFEPPRIIPFIMLTTTCFGRCGPSSGHRIVSQRKAIQVTSISYRYKFIVSNEISFL
jgi:hypothetical protein